MPRASAPCCACVLTPSSPQGTSTTPTSSMRRSRRRLAVLATLPVSGTASPFLASGEQTTVHRPSCLPSRCVVSTVGQPIHFQSGESPNMSSWGLTERNSHFLLQLFHLRECRLYCNRVLVCFTRLRRRSGRGHHPDFVPDRYQGPQDLDHDCMCPVVKSFVCYSEIYEVC
jgi:hypothetical protein